jgi:hypothetical protein
MTPLEPRCLAPLSRRGRAFFRTASPHLDDARFAAKWATSFESPLRFFRAFPQAWYRDLAPVPRAHLTGRSGVCFGDAHPENFGFVVVAGRTHFVFNDFDDSGVTDVGADALRYFVAHALMEDAVASTAELLRRYVAVLGGAKPPALPRAMVPAPAAVVAKQLGKLVAGEALVLSKKTKLSPVTPEERALVARGLERLHLQVHDVALRERDHGGSGGLRRYWALVESRGGRHDVLEVKALTRPATAWGPAHHALKDRLGAIRAALWPGLAVEDHVGLRLGRTEYVVRSRVTRAGLDLEKLVPRQRRAALAAEVGILAAHHRTLLRPGEVLRFGAWLEASLPVMVERWRALFSKLEETAHA